MRRFVLPIAALVLPMKLVGCGGSSTTSVTTGPTEQDLPAEVRETEERQLKIQMEGAAKQAAKNAKKAAH